MGVLGSNDSGGFGLAATEDIKTCALGPKNLRTLLLGVKCPLQANVDFGCHHLVAALVWTQKNPAAQFAGFKSGATCRDRTDDLMITNQLLYQLS